MKKLISSILSFTTIISLLTSVMPITTNAVECLDSYGELYAQLQNFPKVETKYEDYPFIPEFYNTSDAIYYVQMENEYFSNKNGVPYEEEFICVNKYEPIISVLTNSETDVEYINSVVESKNSDLIKIVQNGTSNQYDIYGTDLDNHYDGSREIIEDIYEKIKNQSADLIVKNDMSYEICSGNILSFKLNANDVDGSYAELKLYVEENKIGYLYETLDTIKTKLSNKTTNSLLVNVISDENELDERMKLRNQISSNIAGITAYDFECLYDSAILSLDNAINSKKTINIIKGDVNSDNKLDSKDAVIILQDYANTLVGKKSTLSIENADITEDGIINANDAVKVLKNYAENLVK